jgi:hypothetical protein
MSPLLIQDLDPGLFGFTFGIAAFFGCAFFSRAASFSDVGMGPWP